MANSIVLPGQMVSDKPARLPYCYVENNKTYATVLSLLSDDGRLVPLCGPYEPLLDDYVVSYVSEVRFSGYNININCPANAYLSGREVAQKLTVGDVLYARISAVDEIKSVELNDARLLRGGTIIEIAAAKVPRVIGKKNSMIGMISAATGCEIYVGRNGFIWVSSKGNQKLAADTIRMVEAQAHITGLTDRIKAHLDAHKAAASPAAQN
ncbi:hypothetical protein J4441_03630 [Candidatus Micrarchaeota archaeon]|nr:hypothetical protein [Candidatus Micrarchaeota archaeon]